MKFIEKIPYFGKENPSEKAEYANPEIEALRKPFLSLVEELKESIDSEVYDVLIGDDASGRVPTNALRNVIAERMRIAHPGMDPEKDRDMLKTYFVAGGREVDNSEKLKEYFRKIHPNIKKKALFVTEYIATGESMARIGEIMEKENIPFDIATLGFAIDKNDVRSVPVRKFFMNHKIFTGEFTDMHSAPAIYGRPSIAGVEKNPNQTEAHAKPFFVSGYGNIPESRKDIKKLSEEIVSEVWKK